MTISEFAARLGVSTATVSRAFSDKGRIRATTRAEILRQAEVLAYRPNLHARAMVRGRTDTLALFTNAPREADSDYYVAELTFGITCAAAEAGRSLQIHAVSRKAAENPAHLADILNAGAVDGFIVYLYTEWAKLLVATAEARGMPYVIVDSTCEPSDHVLSMGDAIYAGSVRAAAYFRRLGRCRVGFIHGLHDRHKLAGLRQGLGELADTLVTDPGGVSFADGYEAFGRLHEACPDMNALFCANDVLAVGAIRAAVDRGLRVPGDVSVIGCDDLRLAAFYSPALTTIRLPKFRMGEMAVAKLLSLIEGRPAPAKQELECELIVRESA